MADSVLQEYCLDLRIGKMRTIVRVATFGLAKDRRQMIVVYMYHLNFSVIPVCFSPDKPGKIIDHEKHISCARNRASRGDRPNPIYPDHGYRSEGLDASCRCFDRLLYSLLVGVATSIPLVYILDTRRLVRPPD